MGWRKGFTVIGCAAAIVATMLAARQMWLWYTFEAAVVAGSTFMVGAKRINEVKW